MEKIQIKKENSEVILPRAEHEGDMTDCFADKDVWVNSYECTLIPLGFSMNIPNGYRVKLFARSSLPLKKKLVVSNSVGIIDTNFKGQLCLLCHSLPKVDEHGMLINNPVQVRKGDKIAQFQLEKIENFQLEEVNELDMTNDRGGGFGSTDSK